MSSVSGGRVYGSQGFVKEASANKLSSAYRLGTSVWITLHHLLLVIHCCTAHYVAYGVQKEPDCTHPVTRRDVVTAGTVEAVSTQKKGYKLPRAPMTNSDLTRLINSDEVQSVVRPKKTVRFLFFSYLP